MRTADAVARYGRSALRHAVAKGRMQQPERGVVVDHNARLSRDELDLVRLHAVAPGAAFAGLTALRLDGLKGFDLDDTHLVLPEGSKRLDVDGAVLHWSTELSDLDVHPLLVPRRTRPARSTIDAAAWTSTDRQAVAIVLASFQHGLVIARTMHQAMQRRGPIRRRALIRETVLDAEGGIHSLPERDFDEIRIGAGLPAPTRQARVKRPDGRCYLDAAWETWNVAAEIHGVPHMHVSQWTEDIVRANEVVIAGPRLVAFTSFAIRHQKTSVADQLRRLLLSAGWDGS
ncbi:MAG: hypothetical protein ABW075_01830 [Aeromicrobium sp.]